MANVAVGSELVCARGVPDHEASKALVANEHVGTKAKNEVRYVGAARGSHGIRKNVGGRRLDKHVGRTADTKSRIGRERLASAQYAAELGSETFNR
jgi:hypothetical protein